MTDAPKPRSSAPGPRGQPESAVAFPMRSGEEFDRVRAIAAELGDRAVELGDDVAILAELDGAYLVASIDLSVEGVHFQRDWLRLDEVGWRATTGALSDLASAGARPLGVLVSLGVPLSFDEDAVRTLMRGVGAAADAVDARVVGGDLVRSESVIVDCCVTGRAERLVRRRGATAGDRVWVTGAFGGPGAAVRAWREGREPTSVCRERFAHPQARIDAGVWLAAHGATSMIDVSDGLIADVEHVAAASEVRVVVDLDQVPLIDGVSDAVMAAAGGEEYELIATMPAAFDVAHAREAPVPLTLIGRCEVGTGVETRAAGAPVVVPPGFDHFVT